MLYNMSTHGDEVVVRLSEALIFEDHERFREVLGELSKTKCKRCVLDLSSVTSVDSAGLGMLMIAGGFFGAVVYALLALLSRH